MEVEKEKNVANHDIEAIKRKIRALLSRTPENGATIAEAEVALKKANQLMTEYAIEKYQLGGGEAKRCIEKKIVLHRVGTHITNLASVIGFSFDCEFFYNTYRKDGTYFGYETDVEMCVYFYDLIMNALENEIDKYKSTYDYQVDARYYSPKTVVNSFIKGFTDAIAKKLFLMKHERENNVIKATGTNLVLVKNVREELEKKHPDIKGVDRKAVQSIDDVSLLGKESGENLSLNYGVCQEEKLKIAVN